MKRRILSLVLAVLMLVTSVDITAFAAQNEASGNLIDVETVTEVDPMPTETIEEQPTEEPENDPDELQTPEADVTPSESPEVDDIPSESPEAEELPTSTPQEQEATASPVAEEGQTPTPVSTMTPDPLASLEPSASPTPSVTPTPSVSPTPSISPTPGVLPEWEMVRTNFYSDLLVRSGSEASVTRIEWLEALVTAFQMTVEEENYPDNYYSDIDASSEAYLTAMLATEFGLVDVEAGDSLCPDDVATREFAVHSLNQCLGFQAEATEYTFNEAESVTYPADIQTAIEQGWFTLSDGNFYPEQALTQADKEALLNYANAIVDSTSIDSNYDNRYQLADNVIDLTDVTAQMTDENEYTLYGCTVELKEGDTFAIEMGGMPLVKKVVSVTVKEDALVVLTESVVMEDAFTYIDIQGDTEADLSLVQAYDDEVELNYIVGGTVDRKFEDGEKYASLSEVGGQSISAVELVKSIDIPEEVREKHGILDGVSAKITCTISDVKEKHKFKTNSAYLQIDAVATFSCNVSLDVLESLGQASSIVLAKVPVYGIGYMKVTLDMVLKGDVTLTYAEHITMGVQYNYDTGFRLITDFYKEYFTIAAHAEAAVGFTATVGVDCGVIKGSLYAKAGAKATFDSVTYIDDKLPGKCSHVSAWLYTSVGCNVGVDLILFEYEWEKEITIFDEKNSPVRVAFHYEDGQPVEKCTRENPEEGGETPSRWKYYTPINSKYGYSGVNKGTGSDGKQYTIFEYSLDSYNNATITKYSGNVSALRIPDTLDGYQVVGIDNRVFMDNTRLRMVVIPDSVTEIGRSAFANCTNLSEVVLSKSLETMGYAVFAGCISLTAIEIPKSLNRTELFQNHDYGVFSGCDNLKNVTFESGTTQIATGLFRYCGGIEKIEIPDTVTVIEAYAFGDCKNLKEITIPASVTEIQTEAFTNCTALPKIVIPDSVTSIGDAVFKGCTNLPKIVIPDSVTSMGNSVFRGCTNLSEVVLSKSLEKIGYAAFADCISLTAIEIPKSLNQTELFQNPDYGVFSGCDNLKNVTFESGTTQIAIGLFRYCEAIEKIEIPDTVTVIEAYAFEGCKNLKEITIPASVTEIQNEAFINCTALPKAVIPDSVTSMGNSVFRRCTNLSEVVLSKSLETIGYAAFADCISLTAIEIPKSLNRTELFQNHDYGVFSGCDSLKKVTFESGTTQIAIGLFRYCGAIEKIEIPDTVTVIEAYAFEGCKNLKEITIPASVTEMQYNVFKDCTALPKVVIPDSVTSMGDKVFSGCTNLSEVTLPKSLTSIESRTFEDCKTLATITIPETVTIIRESAFNNTGLTEITIPDNVTVIEKYAFQNCEALTKAAVGEKVSEIRSYAFQNCTSLQTITFGDQLKTIGKYAFQNCDALTAVTIPDSVTSLGTYLFAGCEKLSDVKLGSGITVIPTYAFNACPSLKEIVIPYKVKEIEANAFTNCTSLAKVTIPRATTAIADSVFSYPSKMTIYGVSGTYAETYAKSKNIAFVNQEIPITELAFDQAELKMTKGTSQLLTLHVTPSNFTDTITWRSSDQTVATVSDGTVNAVSIGKAEIRALAGDTGAVKAVCEVTVVQPVTGISLNKTSVTLDGGDTFALKATVRPDNAFNKEIQFSSSDETVASVSETGLITALKKGTSTIKAMAKDGSGRYATCQVTVNSTATIVNDVSELKSEHPYKNDCNELWIYRLEGAENLKVTFSEETETDEGFDFIYVYDSTGAQIGMYTGKQLSGKTIYVPGDTIKIKLISGDAITAYGFEVESVSKAEKPVELISISLNKTATRLKKGATEKLEVIYNPENTTEDKKSVFTSSDEKVVEVASDGNLTAIGAGTATVTAEVAGKTATCKVTVYEGVDNIEISPKELLLHKGETGKVAYTTAPVDAVAESVSWDNSDVAVVEMTEMKGLSYAAVRGLTAGDAVITVDIDGMTATCKVTVKDKITLDYQDGTGTTEEIEAEYGKALTTLSEIMPERDGYIFAGWYTKEDGQGRQVTETTDVTDEWTLYAYWEKEREGFFVLQVGDQPYTGKAIKPAVAVYDGETLLQAKKDYTVSYKNNTKVTADANKMPVITVTGKGNYTGKDTVTFKILPRDIADVSFAADDLALRYNSKVQKPTPVLTWKGKKLKYKTDYTVTFVNESDGSENAYKAPGTYTIMLEGKGNFTGTRTVSLKITEENLISKARFGKIASQPYNAGKEITPGITVKMGGTFLTEGIDYEIAYENNREVGKATAIVTGIGSYVGSKRITFTITGKSLKKAKTEGIVDAYYTGREIEQESRLYVTNKDKSRTYLTEGEDYEVSYQKNLLPGKAAVLFTGINEYKGTSLKKTFRITAYPIATDPDKVMKVQTENEVPFIKGGSKPSVSIYFGSELLKEGVDYTLSYKNNAAVAGPDSEKVPAVTIKGKGRFTGTLPAKSYSIVKQELSKLSITVNDKMFSNKNNAYKTSITITDLNGKKLAAGKDYDKNFIYSYHDDTELSNDIVKRSGDEVESSDIIPAGTVIDVTVKAKENSNYSGQIKGSYRIISADIKSAQITIPPQTYTGREIKLKKEDIKVFIKGYTLKPEEFEIVEGSYVNNIKKGTAKVTIKAVSKNYGGRKTVSFKIVSKKISW